MLILFLLISLLSLAPPTIAADNFTSEQQIVYQINHLGHASVRQTVTLTNNYSEIYAKEYQISLSIPNITNITGTDQQGNIIKSINQETDRTVINLEFNQPAIGKDQSTRFNINYQLPNLASQKGRVWEIPLPHHKNDNLDTKIQVTVKVPQNFGQLSFSSLPYTDLNSLDQVHTVHFNQTSLAQQKILLIFGDYQVFDFDLTYFLKNPSSENIKTEIAIPPDTDNQKIIYRQISPPPQNVHIDNDGNWLAQYYLSPKQNIEILASGQVKITSSTSPVQQSPPDQNQLTQSQKYWPVNDPDIQQIAQKLETAKDIYDYVVSHLDYNYQQINNSHRQGALFAIQNPHLSLCTEFTDLFITLARAKGIPAREVEGFAYTNNPKIKPTNPTTDILHAWPQYYHPQKKTWISIDPTWAKTTKGIDYFNDLDLNHFAFVFHGHDSLYPPPPGSYKDNLQIKTVAVDFSNQELSSQSQTPQITTQGKQLIIKNNHLEAFTQLQLSLPSLNWEHTIPVLPPFASVNINLPSPNFFTSILPQNRHLKLQVQHQNHQPTNQIVKNPNHLYNLAIAMTILTTIILTSGIILVNRSKKS